MMNLSLSLVEKRQVERTVESNILFATSVIGICFFISLIHLFVPDWHHLLFPVNTMESKILDYIGIFLVKISFICNIVLYFQVTDKFSLEYGDLGLEKILRMESLIVFTNVLLCAGVFIYISNVFSLTTFIYALCFFSYRKLRT